MNSHTELFQNNPLLYYSTNPQVTANLTKSEGGKITHGWVLSSTPWNEESLSQMVRTQSYINSRLKDGYKVKANVQEIFFLTLDFDKGTPTLEKVIREAADYRFSCFIHTTVSHQLPKAAEDGTTFPSIDRFRMLVPLNRPISLQELETMKSFWLEKFPKLDGTCFDGNRYFMMNPNAQTFIHNITDEYGKIKFLEPEEILSKTKSIKPNKQDNADKRTFKQTDIIITKDKKQIEVSQVNGKIEIFCPFCDPKNRTHPESPNAFIDINKHGDHYIYCSSEDETFWVEQEKFIVKDNEYHKRKKMGKSFEDLQVTSFTITPKELLNLPGRDVLKCDVVSSIGQTYKDLLLENTDWHSKQKLLKAIGHQDCTFIGSDNDVQALCEYINKKVPARKTGTSVIGLIDDVWTIKGMNITAHGIVEESVVPYGRGLESFYHKIAYKETDGEEYKKLINGIYGSITQINTPEVIFPWLGVFFATPLKPILMRILGGFPLMFAHGGMGSGKTSTAQFFMRLAGYVEPNPFSCTMKPFPMLKLLSSTNAVPVFLDEFKSSDMKFDEINTLLRFMRKAYSGEVESKGRPDQTTEDYELLAPITVMGEWSITQPATKERVIVASFTNEVKKNKNMQNSFDLLRSLDLEGFMPKYIEFCLKQDVKSILKISEGIVNSQTGSLMIAPRIKKNLSVMVFGLEMFRMFAESHSIELAPIGYKKIITKQIEEITGTKTGFVRSAVDQLLEELSVMAQNEKIKTESFKVMEINEKSGTGIKALAIRFNQVYPIFKQWAQYTKYEGDILNKEAYMKLFGDCDYVISKNHMVKFPSIGTHRCLVIDIEKSKQADINLEGFGI